MKRDSTQDLHQSAKIFRLKQGTPNGIMFSKREKKFKLGARYQSSKTKTGPYIYINLGWWDLLLVWGHRKEDYFPNCLNL